MRAFVVTEYAHPSKIPITQNAPEPQVGPGQVLVDVYSAGLNYFDVSPTYPRVVHYRRSAKLVLIELTGSSRAFSYCNHKASTSTSHEGHLF